MDKRFSCGVEVVGRARAARNLRRRDAARRVTCLVIVILFFSVGCSAPRQVHSPAQVQRRASSPAGREVGVASYYAHKYHGRKTASGETYNMHDLTAAHRTLPFGATVRVTNLTNGNSVTVRINDRGPYARGRLIDLSLAAARKLDMVRAGVARVEVAAGPTPPQPAVATLPK